MNLINNMFRNQLRYVQPSMFSVANYLRCYESTQALPQSSEYQKENEDRLENIRIKEDNPVNQIFPSSRVVPMVVTKKDQIILSFDEVPGPKALKYLSSFRYYLTEIGTQVTAGILTLGLNVGSFVINKKSIKNFSTLFDEYGPVVRFVSPVGNDIVLLNHPDHIQKVYTMEGEYPVRSTLDSLEKYRLEHRNKAYGGLYSINGQDWSRRRSAVYTPLHNSVLSHMAGVSDVCDKFTQKVYDMRNHQDEINKDLYKELHKWAFDCMGLIIFSKRFTMLDTELVYSQCDMSWLYSSLEKATLAIDKCESGWHLWKLFRTPAWLSLIKHCDNMDDLIGKHVMTEEQTLSMKMKNENALSTDSVISSMLLCEERFGVEDISTILMDMLLIGVNTVTSSMSFLLYHLAKYQHSQKALYDEIAKLYPEEMAQDITKIKQETPYLQACIKETLRLVPPIPVLTRILPRNITLDRYNIPRGTLIIMSTQDASLKEYNYDDAKKFNPERWLKPDLKESYHTFASIPFGFGARKCLGQSIAESMLSLLTIKIMQKYKLEYHYGDIQATRSFIARPNKPLKIRILDRN